MITTRWLKLILVTWLTNHRLTTIISYASIRFPMQATFRAFTYISEEMITYDSYGSKIINKVHNIHLSLFRMLRPQTIVICSSPFEGNQQSALRIVFRWPRSGRHQNLHRVETRYEKTGTFLIRTYMSTEKTNRAAEPRYRPARPLLRCLQSRQRLTELILHVQRVD